MEGVVEPHVLHECDMLQRNLAIHLGVLLLLSRDALQLPEARLEDCKNLRRDDWRWRLRWRRLRCSSWGLYFVVVIHGRGGAIAGAGLVVRLDTIRARLIFSASSTSVAAFLLRRHFSLVGATLQGAGRAEAVADARCCRSVDEGHHNLLRQLEVDGPDAELRKHAD